MRFSLRFATTLCYFLPFTFFLATCGEMGPDFSYNKKEAAKKILISNQNARTIMTGNIDTNAVPVSSPIIIDEAHMNVDSIINDYNAGLEKKDKKFSDRVFITIMTPVKSSVSAIGGLMFYKNTAGKIFISVSMLMSLVLLLGFKWIKLKKVIGYILLINIIAVSVFICICYFSDVGLLYGAWVLLFILIAQFRFERA